MWYQLYVKSDSYTTPERVKPVDSFLNSRFASAFKSPDGLPVQEPDGTWEIRVWQESILPAVKFALTEHFGFDVVKEIEHE